MNDRICTIEQYLESKPDMLVKIRALDALISSMELKLTEVVDSAVYDEYSMDDGQMKVRTKYRNSADVMGGIKGLEIIRERYINKYNGRRIIFRGGKII